MIPANNITGCTVTSTTSANVTASWSVGGPGENYVIVVAARHQGAEFADEETVAVLLLNVEYPAPPAVANNYIKSQGWKLTAGCRGYVISNVALNHGMDEKYGSKGGPYNTSLIQSDVTQLRSECP